MKLTIYAIIALLLLPITGALAQVRVDGYTRSNGTYVAPHYRSSPDSSFGNNWSTSGNSNPYTGQAGTRTYGGTYGGNSLGSGSYGGSNNLLNNSGNLGANTLGNSCYGLNCD